MMQKKDSGTAPATAPQVAPKISRDSSGSIVVVIQGDVMGRGSDELGALLMKGFVHTLTEADPAPNAIILFNHGVKLAIAGAETVDDLQLLEKRGVTVLACGTCLEYLNVKDRLQAGQVSNMYDITERMIGAGKLISI